MAGVQKAFVSHSSEDAALAAELRAALEAAGIPCWIAPRDVPAGKSWAEGCMLGIEACDGFVLLATVSSVISQNVLAEVERARHFSRDIYTVMIDQPRLPREMTFYLMRLHWLASGSGDIHDATSRLVQALQGKKSWEAVATPPSLGRRIRSTVPAFVGATAAIMLGLLIVGLAGLMLVHRVQHSIATDFRSIGWVTFDDTATPAGKRSKAVGHLWLGEGDRTFSTVGLHARLATSDSQQPLDLSSQLPTDGTREAEIIMNLPSNASSITTLLTVPHGSQFFCVTQHFPLYAGQVLRGGDPTVSLLNNKADCA